MADPFCWSYGSNSSQNQKLSAVYADAGFIVPVYLLLYQAFTLYTPMRMQGRRLVLANIVKANSLGLLILMFTFYMIDESDFSRSTYIMFYVINIVLQWCARMLIFALLRNMREKGLNQKQMICVGYSRAAEEYIDRVLANPQWGYVIRGILDDNVPAGTEYKGIKVLGRIANLNIILPENRLDEIAITLGLSEYYRLEEIVALCENPEYTPSLSRIIIRSFRQNHTQKIYWDFRLSISVMYR